MALCYGFGVDYASLLRLDGADDKYQAACPAGSAAAVVGSFLLQALQ
jgi:hypothetical protein